MEKESDMSFRHKNSKRALLFQIIKRGVVVGASEPREKLPHYKQSVQR